MERGNVAEMSEYKKKLIEVALPLEVINREATREKSIRQGHPSTLHLWWARRPLAACRAVLFAQLVDDPSSDLTKFPDIASQEKERTRLFSIMEKLVVWENVQDANLLRQANDEIKKSIKGELPFVYDPFAGGGSIPLEAQRLGLKAIATDLNPVAVLINRALIEIPPKFFNKRPIFPGLAEEQLSSWTGTDGLAADVRNYGQWMYEEAQKSVGHFYPKIKTSGGSEATVIAWLWARTIICPNPACGVKMPLIRNFYLSTRKNHDAWLKTKVIGKDVKYEVVIGKGKPEHDSLVNRNGAVCIACGTPAPLSYVREFGMKHGLGSQLLATVIDGGNGRTYISPTEDQIELANSAKAPESAPEELLIQNLANFSPQKYGMTSFGKLFTNRQLLALEKLSALVGEAHDRVQKDAIDAGMAADEAKDYAKAISLYLSFGVSRMTNSLNALNRWEPSREQSLTLFSRQAIPMVWDFAEATPFSGAAGDFMVSVNSLCKALQKLPATHSERVSQKNAEELEMPPNTVVSTDPPYYDNIGYADLSDFFYVWLRKCLGGLFPEDTQTILTPKKEELVAGGFRNDKSFEDGFLNVFTRIRKGHREDIPMTVFYAFKQTEEDSSGSASTGWETMLNGLISAGFSITATWPIRTELSNRMIGSGANALASSIVLSCRPKEVGAEAVTRRSFVSALKSELPVALRNLQHGNVAPVDLAQAAIGPGMSVFTRYSRVIEADGADMDVRMALALINQVLDEVLTEQEGDFDSETRFCIKWFTQYGWNSSNSGEADLLSRAVNTSLVTLERGGVFSALAGTATLIHPKDMASGWDPLLDKGISIWEVTVQLAYILQNDGIEKAQEMIVASSKRVEIESVKELSYLLFSISEKKGWTESAIMFNALGTSWSDFNSAIHAPVKVSASQEQLEL